MIMAFLLYWMIPSIHLLDMINYYFRDVYILKRYVQID